ncbi:hypothetical protein M758_10G138500 [Ceratodon purpureus]|nr:hypothetical protein M758_10G138500 [Ceratodon purpureus]
MKGKIEVEEIRLVVVPNDTRQENNPLQSIAFNDIKDVEDVASNGIKDVEDVKSIIEEIIEKTLEETTIEIYRQHQKKQIQPTRSHLGNTFLIGLENGQIIL